MMLNACLNENVTAKVETKSQTKQENKSEVAAVSQTPEKPWSDEQAMALHMILAGTKIKETAERLSVDRRTINRWMKHPKFEAGMAERKQLLRGALRGQLAGMVRSAFDGMRAAVDNDDFGSAISLLQSMKVLDGTPLSSSEDAYLADVANEMNSQAEASATELNAVSSAAAMGQRGHSAEITAEPVDEETEQQTDLPSQDQLPELTDEEKAALKREALHCEAAMGQRGHSTEITALQQKILAGLEEGKSLAEATHDAGTTVDMLQRWLQQDAPFRAAIQADRLQMESYWELRSLQLGYHAAECVQRALNAGNGRIALAVLKGLAVV